MSLWQETQSTEAWGDAFSAAALKAGASPLLRFPARAPGSWHAAQSSELGGGATAGVGCLVLAVMAAEAAEEIVVADVVGMSAPRDLHLGEDVAQIDGFHLLGRGLDDWTLALVGLRVLGLVEVRDRLRDLFRRRRAVGILDAQRGDGLLLDVRQLPVDPARRDGLVHGALGHLERVRGPVVTVHAVHLPALRAGQLLCGRLHLVGDVLDLPAIVLRVRHAGDDLAPAVG